MRLPACLAVAALTLIAGCGPDLVSPHPAGGLDHAAFARSVQQGSLVATATSSSRIELTWTNNAGNASGWEVHRAPDTTTFTNIAVLGPVASSYADAGLPHSADRCYRVRSFKTTGRKVTYATFSNIACARTHTPPSPAAPSNMNAVPKDGLVHVTWTDNAGDETGFRVEQGITPSGPWQLARTVGANVTSVFIGVPAEQAACFRVIALGAAESAPSNVDCTVVPAKPTGLTAASPDPTSVIVSWTDNSSVEDGFQLWRAQAPSGSWTQLALPANATTYTDVVTADYRYSYMIRAGRDGGFSHFSETVDVAAVSRPPEAPREVWTLAQGSTLVTAVAWLWATTTADAIRFERSTDDGVTWAMASEIPLTRDMNYQVMFADAGRQADQRVCHRAIAVNRLGQSPPSNVDCATPPAAPSEVTVTNLGNGEIEVRWKDNSSVEDSYAILVWYYDGMDTYVEQVASVPANSTHAVIPDYGANIAVVAIKDDGSSDWGVAGVPGMSGVRAAPRLRR